MDENIHILEGQQRRIRVRLQSVDGTPLAPENFRVYGGAFCPGFSAAHFHAERNESEWLLTQPGLKPGRVPWNYQVIVAEFLTGVEWLVQAGEITVLDRYAHGNGYVDPGELCVTACLDKTTQQLTVTLGDSSAQCSKAVMVSLEHAQAAAGHASDADVSARQAEIHEAGARQQAEASRESATAADGARVVAQDAASMADSYCAAAQDAQADAEAAAGAASEHAAEAAGAAKDAEDALAKANTAAENSRQRATEATAARDDARKASAAADERATDADAAAAAAAAAAAEAARVTGADQAALAEKHAQTATLEAARAKQQAELAKNNAELAIVHTADESVHVTGTEHRHLQRLIAAFPEVAPDAPTVVQPALPAEALPWSVIEQHFAQHAAPGITQAPGEVFVSRVPWARWDAASSSWKNTTSQVDETAMGCAQKLLDNAGLRHAQSTDTVAGVDDYIGKKWAFYCAYGNYVKDAQGVMHVTAVEGYRLNGAEFDPDGPVCAFGPAVWMFEVLERYQDADGNWCTHDGTETGEPLFQLWGISDRPWSELDESRRSELMRHGVTEADFYLRGGCMVYSEADSGLVRRPYYANSAFCGGYEVNEGGDAVIVSKRNKILYKNLSYQTINAKYGYAAGGGGAAWVNGVGIVYDIVKNAQKNSQKLHTGMSSNDQQAVKASVSTAEPGYVFPIASKGQFEVGCTVWVWQTASSASGTAQATSLACQVGRIDAIETRTLLLADGSSADALCLVLDPETVEPFLVRTGADNAAAIAAAREMSDAGAYCHCFATQGQALSGETLRVLGKHDGSCTSNTNQKHPYRVQLTEYMPGAYICAADTLVVKGNGTTAVEYKGEMYLPTSAEYVYMTAPVGVTRVSQWNLQQLINAGYVCSGIGTATGGFILNVRMSPAGVVFPTHAGGTGSGSDTGHGDQLYVGVSPAEFLAGGCLNYRDAAGSACLDLNNGPGNAFWNIGGRD